MKTVAGCSALAGTRPADAIHSGERGNMQNMTETPRSRGCAITLPVFVRESCCLTRLCSSPTNVIQRWGMAWMMKHFGFTRINIAPAIRHKRIEDFGEASKVGLDQTVGTAKLAR